MRRNNFIASSYVAFDYSEDNNISLNASNTMMNPFSIKQCMYIYIPSVGKKKAKYISHNHAKKCEKKANKNCISNSAFYQCNP